jgi:hypothetical protein
MRSLIALATFAFVAQAASANVVTLQASKDNTLYQENQSNSNGAGPSFFAGPNGLSFMFRGLIAFDIAANVPAGSTINSVQLTLNMTMTQSGILAVELHRPLADWGEGTTIGAGTGGGFGAPASLNDATWLHRFFPSTFWTTPGGDFSATVTSSTLVDQIGAYTWPSTATFVSDVQSYLDAPAGNFGWFVILPVGIPAKRFASRENPTASLRPVLTIDYTPNPGTGFCFGDGSGTACPCANVGLPGNGCANFEQPNGAHLQAAGNPSIAADTLVIQGSGMSNVGAVLYFQGSGQQVGGAGFAFGDGLFCAGGTIIRLGVKFNVGGASQWPGVGDPSLSVQGLVTTPGAVENYQGWYRDSAVFCSPSTFNLTNGVNVTWGA